MEQVNRICRHPLWQESMEQIRKLEQDRIFCRHDIAHCLDVARLAYLENLEKHMKKNSIKIWEEYQQLQSKEECI